MTALTPRQRLVLKGLARGTFHPLPTYRRTLTVLAERGLVRAPRDEAKLPWRITWQGLEALR